MKLKLLVAAACAAFGTALFAAGELDEAVLHGETDKARAIDYAPGETMTFTLTLQRAKPFAEGAYFIQWRRSGDDGVVEEGKESASKPFIYRTKTDKPGFVRLTAFVVDKDGKRYQKSFRGNPNTAMTLTLASSKLLATSERTSSGSTAFSNCTLKLRPPVKSMLRLKPRMAMKPMQMRKITPPMVSQRLRGPMKSK